MDYLPPCITSPGIAAVVHRRLNELYFAHLLEALHSSASGIGASFTTTSEKEDSISNEILEYLAFCVAFSRATCGRKKTQANSFWTRRLVSTTDTPSSSCKTSSQS